MGLPQYHPNFMNDDGRDLDHEDFVFGLQRQELANFDDIAKYPWQAGNDRPRREMPRRQERDFLPNDALDDQEIADSAFDDRPLSHQAPLRGRRSGNERG